jgi:thiamine-phosphate pyrophosphorylase
LLLYYITDRLAFPGDEHTRRQRLLDKIAEATSHGIDYIQLREKDLSARELESLAREASRIILQRRTKNQELRTSLLINSRADIALATADGVHLRAADVSPQEVRTAWRGAARCGAGTPFGKLSAGFAREISARDPLVSVSCHSLQEVVQAAAHQAAFAVLAPVFEKKATPEVSLVGLETLRQACHSKIPVLALGGITLQNAPSCLRAGAAGIAAIRLFQENDIATVVRELRG